MTKFRQVSIICTLFWVSAIVAEPTDKGPFTLEQILSTPFPSGMTAAPDGGLVAWVFNEKGARNIWVAEPPSYEGRRLTSWTQDDGQTISQLSWTPGGKQIVFVRGDGANRRGELPNPLHRVEGTERAIWVAGVSDGRVRKLTEGAGPTVSPDGEGVAFVRGGDIWWIPLKEAEGEEEVKATPLVKSRGGSGSLRWSPDGSHLAFVSRRGAHSYIGLFSMKEESLRFLDPSLDRDGNPVWSPDGTQLAFTRIPSTARIPIFTPQRSGLPWSIRVSDAGSAKSRAVWTADEGAGSVLRSIVAPNQIFWSTDGRIVFAWEKEGRTHLYSVPAAGGRPTALTPGHFDVEQVVLSADGKHVVYSSNQGDIDRRHIWKVPAAGGPAEALTSGPSNEWSPAPTSNGAAIALIRSTGTQPAQPAILAGSKSTRLLAPGSLPSDFPSDHLVEPEQVIFASADGMKIHGQLFRPPAGFSGKRPAMLYFHGGSRRQMLLGWHYSNYYHNCFAMNQYMASRGYVVMSVNYRSGIGYGMEFREALNYGAAGASEFNDVLGAGLYLQSRTDVDPERIGLWGGSYGGYLTALGLSRASDLFAAGVDVHGVHDWNKVIQGFVPSYNPLAVPKAARLAFESSPMASIDGWKSPVLLIHGDDDRNVPFMESIELAEALRERGVEFESLVFPDEVHGFLLHRSWLDAFRAAANFVDRKLGDNP